MTQHVALIGKTGEGPQWSPPFRGGMTPAGEPRSPSVRQAAMEPALQGRDDSQWSAAYPATVLQPQWSPPFRGGMTLRQRATVLASTRPQWSPPFRGGMTDPRFFELAAVILAAMEPALQGRDDRPGPVRRRW